MPTTTLKPVFIFGALLFAPFLLVPPKLFAQPRPALKAISPSQAQTDTVQRTLPKGIDASEPVDGAPGSFPSEELIPDFNKPFPKASDAQGQTQQAPSYPNPYQQPQWTTQPMYQQPAYPMYQYQQPGYQQPYQQQPYQQQPYQQQPYQQPTYQPPAYQQPMPNQPPPQTTEQIPPTYPGFQTIPQSPYNPYVQPYLPQQTVPHYYHPGYGQFVPMTPYVQQPGTQPRQPMLPMQQGQSNHPNATANPVINPAQMPANKTPAKIKPLTDAERVSRLEKVTFGTTYPKEEVSDRVDRLEAKVYGKTKDGAVHDRISSLEKSKK